MSTRLVATTFLVVFFFAGCRPQPASEAGLTGDGAVLYADDFTPETTGKWQLEGDERGQALLQDGHLIIEVNEPNTIQYVALAEQSFSNFALEVDATLLGGSADSTFGVLFRMTSPEQFYRFDVTGNGLFVVERYDEGGTWTRLSDDWQEASGLQTGAGATNRLGVLAVAGTFSFYANGELLLQVADGRYSGGNVALASGTFGQPGLRVAFDNLVVRRP
jgi:hypothetical protein